MTDDRAWADRFHYREKIINALRSGDFSEEIDEFIQAFGRRRGLTTPETEVIRVKAHSVDLGALKPEQAWERLWAFLDTRTEESKGTTQSRIRLSGPELLNEFWVRRSLAETPIYRMIEAEPERHPLLITLYIFLGPDRFEQFVQMWEGVNLHIPTKKEMADFDRDRLALEMYSRGDSVKKIARKFDLSPSRVYQIIKKEQSRLHLNMKFPEVRRLLSEFNLALKAVRTARAISQLRQPK